MSRSRLLYGGIVAAAVAVALYSIYINYIYDPLATNFLSHKTDLKRPLVLSAWLNVMYIHVAFACLALLTGALNFSNTFMQKYRRLHKLSGYIYLASVLIVVITSGYMAPYATGGKAASMPFNILNILWPAMTITAIVKIRKKQIDRHRKWMVRSYAFCFTNILIHAVTWLLGATLSLSYADSYTAAIYVTIVLLLLLAELVIRTVYRGPAG